MTSRKKRPPAGSHRNNSRASRPNPLAPTSCEWRLPSGQSLGAFALQSGLSSASSLSRRRPAPEPGGAKS